MQVERTSQGLAAPARRFVAWGDFGLALLGALALVALVALGDAVWFLSPVRLILGSVYVLYVPGYCLTAALFPAAEDLDRIERLGLSLGLSIAIVPLLALLLDRLPWGLRVWPIVLGECAVMALCIAVALVRRARLSPPTAYVPELRWRPRAWWRGLPPIERRVYSLAGGALLLAALCTAWVLIVPAPGSSMTEFYMLGKQGHAEEYPREAKQDEDLAVTLGINNHEREAHTYRLEVWVQDAWQPDRRALVKQAGDITLAPGESWRSPLTWRMPWAGDDQQVEFLLFSGDAAEPYRRLQFWVDVQPNQLGVPAEPQP